MKGGFGKACCSTLRDLFYVYETPKIVHIKNYKIGLCNRFVQLSIISYVIGWVLIANKGYQAQDQLIFSTTSKVKGTIYSTGGIPGAQRRIWDEADIVIPPQQPKRNSICKNETDCKKGRIVPGGHGVQTGRCIESDVKTAEDVKVCEIFAWCPIERRESILNQTYLDISNVTVMIKNHIKFPKLNVVRNNLLFTDRVCFYNASDPIKRYSCPIFRLADILKEAKVKREDISIYGGVIIIMIRWDCNLDRGEDACLPKYKFVRLNHIGTTFSTGWNFRYAEHYMDLGVQKRNLVKVFGIRFIVLVQGTAGKFNVIPLLQNVGSGLAILSVATILCDVFVLYCLRDRAYYRRNKFKYVEEIDGNDDDIQNGEGTALNLNKTQTYQ
ncbi:P2X purinoceptor 4-like isoform X2 [Tubulanus polymorphus]|uniref:P2X purinoceptor 4-like isoform X2 n=1 Tax=Tubulanus polymorphus TaxID=672921 RepID=UPI003DA597FC